MENNNGGHPLETGGRWTGIDGGARGGQGGEGRVRALWYAVEVVQREERTDRRRKEVMFFTILPKLTRVVLPPRSLVSIAALVFFPYLPPPTPPYRTGMFPQPYQNNVPVLEPTSRVP